MTRSAEGRGSERRSDDTFDFLRRLSIADAKVLLDKTREEKEKKKEEMQKMIGGRYRDLIESADEIVAMHSAAMRLEVSLKEMPEMWQQMEAALTNALDMENYPECANMTDAAHVTRKEGDYIKEASDVDQVAFLVEVTEKMWRLLDEGKSLEVLELYEKAERIHDEWVANGTAEREFPFLQSQWACVQCFRPRILAYANSYLTCRGKNSQFYADSLSTLAVLTNPRISAEKIVEMFFESRSTWLTSVYKRHHDKWFALTPSQKERTLVVILKSTSWTIIQTEEIFCEKTGLLTSTSLLPRSFKGDLEACISSGKLLEMLSRWFQQNQQQIREVVSAIISSIDSMTSLSQVRSKLVVVNKTCGSCQNATVWQQLCSGARADQPGSVDKHVEPPVESVFSVLYAEAFRKRTRDLVQNSFVEALEAIKSQFRAHLHETVAGVSLADLPLGNIKFYDHFEKIQKKCADIDASELQSVLTEEFFRTLLKLVVFVEQEYPIPGNCNHACVKSETQLSSIHLNISNIFAGIVAEFPHRINNLLPGHSSAVSIPEKDPASSIIGQTFEKYAVNGFVESAYLRSALKEIIEGDEKMLQVCFIDDVLGQAGSLGWHSFCLVAELKQQASYSQAFINVMHGLSAKYCEAWADILLEQKIEPLRELMHAEQYKSTNEEWIAAHEGWVEQEICDEDLGGGAADSSSESEIALGAEKVWLPWCETPTVSSFLFSCCYSLDNANRLIQSPGSAKAAQMKLMQHTMRDVLVDRLTVVIVTAYDAAVSLLVEAKTSQKDSVLNFGECCIQQFLFDMYFVRATLGFSDFIRFGWGDELDTKKCSPGLLKLKALFERMREFIDPVDWEIYGPQLIGNVVLQFRKSRLLFSSLSESNDINKINGKEIVIVAHETRPLARIAEPVARFSLLPVPLNRRKFRCCVSPPSEDGVEKRSRASSTSLFHERAAEDDGSSFQPTASKLQNLLSSSTSSNILSAATSGTNLLSSAAKGIGFLSSATHSRYF
uniref:Conserved oligomeric Golgi complex subunit 1 n=1 Tax=Peronospora matthiolae TaxID=2874970 RepID=A0AAV1UJU0_9STRA